MINLHVDVDNLWMYEQEYAIRIYPDKEYIYTTALPRLLNLLDKTGSKATFMVIGRDLELEAARTFCKLAVNEGHEIANHSYTHPVKFTKLNLKQKLNEVITTHEIISSVCKVKPVGFRSPGFDLDKDILPLLKKLGYRYDSSILPGPAQLLMSTYATLKGGEIKNKSFGKLKDIFSQTNPYRLYYLNSIASMTELPISVLPWFRLPIHTTFAYYFGEKYQKLIFNYLKSKPKYVLYLMHAIDFVDLPITKLDHPVIPLRYSYQQRRVLLSKILDSLVSANDGPLQTSRNNFRTSRH